MTDDLWPKQIKPAEFRAPASIIKEQAAILGERTKYLVEAKVTLTNKEEDTMEYTFSLSSPALGGYRFRLFRVRYDVFMYPLYIYLDKEIYDEVVKRNPKEQQSSFYKIKIKDEAELLDILRSVFGARKTKDVIAAMLAQAKA